MSFCPIVYTVSFVDLFLIYNASFCTWRNIKIYSKEAQIWGVIHSCIIAVKTVIEQAFVCLLSTFNIWERITRLKWYIRFWSIENFKKYNVKTVYNIEITNKLFYQIKTFFVILLQFQSILIPYKPVCYWEENINRQVE